MIKNKEVLGQRADIFVSAVVALRSDLAEGVKVKSYIRKLHTTLRRNYMNYEIIIVDNALPPENIKPISRLLGELPCIRVVTLSRRYSHDTAIMAGLEASIGDYTLITDPALDPVGAIKRIVKENQKTDIIQGVAHVDGTIKSLRTTLPRRIFYWYTRKYVLIDVPTNATYFIALSRRATSAITSNTRKSVHIRFLIRTIGYSYAQFHYSVLKNPLRGRSLRVGLFEAIDIVSSYSVHPLRFVTWFGFVASLASVLYALYVVFIALSGSHVAEGWTTMSLQISGLFFILFFILIILAEYIGKVLIELRQDPKYLIADEQTSTVSVASLNRKNISKG